MDPGLVWLFYGYRRHMALNAKPNAAHYALAELAKRNNNFLCLTQNVDSESLGAKPQGQANIGFCRSLAACWTPAAAAANTAW